MAERKAVAPEALPDLQAFRQESRPAFRTQEPEIPASGEVAIHPVGGVLCAGGHVLYEDIALGLETPLSAEEKRRFFLVWDMVKDIHEGHAVKAAIHIFKGKTTIAHVGKAVKPLGQPDKSLVKVYSQYLKLGPFPPDFPDHVPDPAAHV